MQRKIVCIVLTLCAALTLSAQESYEARVRKYIEQYKDWAIAEQRRSGVPAAITLAQGIHETSAGGSELALNANNHFGIKCKKEWNGETYTYTDDAPDECFRKYSSALQSYKDHSDYLAGSKRYESLFKLKPHDYKGWAVGLKRCGYATNPKYSQILIKLVEAYNLQEYTLVALSSDYNPVKDADRTSTTVATSSKGGEVIPDQDARPSAAVTSGGSSYANTSSRRSGLSVSYGASAKKEVKKNLTEEEEPLAEDPEKAEYGKLVKVNGVKAFYAKKGTVLLEDAFRFHMRYAKLLEINELPDLPLEADMYIYLERKNPKGIHRTHIVKPGETLIQIAQAEAMQLRYLKYYNRIAANEEPAEGETLQLQEYSETKPATYVKNFVRGEEPAVTFAGSRPKAVPQGATRTRASYITKKEINAAQSPVATVKKKEIKKDRQEEDRQEAIPVVAVASVAQAEKKEPEIIETRTVQEKIAEPLPASAVEPEHDIDTPNEKQTQQTEESSTPESVAETSQPSPAEAAENVDREVAHETPEVPVQEVQTEVVPAEVLAAVPSEMVAEESDTLPVELHKNETPKKEEVEYEIVQPDPIVVGKPALATTDSTPEPEDNKKPEAETINPLVPTKPTPTEAKTEMVAAAPEKVDMPVIEEEPKDEYARLKAKLDKVVYSTPSVTSKPATEVKKEEVKKADGSKEVKKTETAKATNDSAKMYTVKKGDTAFSIAKKHNITMRQLLEWNKLDFKEIKAGQQLRVRP